MVCTSVVVYNIDDLYADLWSGHLVLVVVGVRMSIQCLASCTDRILQATCIDTSLFLLLCHINIAYKSQTLDIDL